MRPVRIEVEGFAAFRERAVVDLADTDLFALVGPTGAGKSTVIDAMVFALYGSVPRYGSKGLVYPVITQGALEARVRLDFLVGDDEYTATRVVRRTKTGATTKEARLEHGDAVVADDADGLTRAVADLLGLDLEQFTKCVVLPQGAFATLLHDTKATRQDLLVKLLDLGLYERLAGLARATVKASAQRIEFLDEQIARSAHATPEAVREALDRAEKLDGVVAAIDDAAPALAELDERISTAEVVLAEADRAIAALSVVGAPDDVGEVGHAAAAANAAVTEAAEAEREAADAVAAATTARQELPDPTALRSVATDRQALAELTHRVDKGNELLADAVAAAARAQAAVDDATAAHDAALAEQGRARVAHAAAELAQHVHPGDDCPVCGTEIVSLPDIDATALAEADAEVQARDRTLRDAERHVAEADKTVAKYRFMLDERAVERDQLTERLTGAPSADEIEKTLAMISAADATLEAARAADHSARANAARLRTAAESAAARVVAARATFTSARDQVAAYGPPSATDDLVADWKELVQWAEGECDRRSTAQREATQDRETARTRRDERLSALVALAEGAGVEVGPPSTLRDRTVAASASARARHEQLEREVAAIAEVREERSRLDERRQVHDLLAEQLGASGFEAWLLDEALDALLDGASGWLEQLSSGRYAMAVDDKKQFAVIDHANADERRIARTLSGGETFLASLALALALAERVSELAATGGNSLDAIFLDEGFGTLDPDTLDVVATAIEELGATGRMVGIISHVAELAERVPVRFEVTKSPGTSTVHRVEA